VLRKRPRSWRSGVMIEVVGWDGLLYTLKYKSIEAVDMRLRDGDGDSAGTLFERWGYSELTDEGGDAFRHSILFSSGSEMSIVFKRFSYTRKRPFHASLC
jgi:hypothetical protein